MLGAFDFVDLTRVISEVLAHFIAQVCVGVFVAHNFHGAVYADCAVVGCYNDLCSGLSYAAEKFKGGTMAEP